MLDRDAVHHVAKLARLKITDAEADLFAVQLTSILGAFEELSRVDTANANGVICPTEMPQQLRKDEAQKTSTADEILANAPERSGHLFKVPPVV